MSQQAELGIDVVTDGEVERENYIFHFVWVTLFTKYFLYVGKMRLTQFLLPIYWQYIHWHQWWIHSSWRWSFFGNHNSKKLRISIEIWKLTPSLGWESKVFAINPLHCIFRRRLEGFDFVNIQEKVIREGNDSIVVPVIRGKVRLKYCTKSCWQQESRSHFYRTVHKEMSTNRKLKNLQFARPQQTKINVFKHIWR